MDVSFVYFTSWTCKHVFQVMHVFLGEFGWISLKKQRSAWDDNKMNLNWRFQVSMMKSLSRASKWIYGMHDLELRCECYDSLKTHQLMLALHHTSAVLQHMSLVHHPLKVLNVSSLQNIGQSIIQAIQETFLLLLISADLMRGIAGQLSEHSDILVHTHRPLFQILKLFLL
jgi:hypothetical protein